eukprot:scaffold20920_cov67-Phaeocystis_antarctica.AAC.13
MRQVAAQLGPEQPAVGEGVRIGDGAAERTEGHERAEGKRLGRDRAVDVISDIRDEEEHASRRGVLRAEAEGGPAHLHLDVHLGHVPQLRQQPTRLARRRVAARRRRAHRRLAPRALWRAALPAVHRPLRRVELRQLVDGEGRAALLLVDGDDAAHLWRPEGIEQLGQ